MPRAKLLGTTRLSRAPMRPTRKTIYRISRVNSQNNIVSVFKVENLPKLETPKPFYDCSIVG